MSSKPETFASMLRYWREKKNLSQRELAEKIDTAHSHIATMERNVRSLPSRDVALALIHALELWPPTSDNFLVAAGHDNDRSEDEERAIQRTFNFYELIVFARLMLDPDEQWYPVVENNLVKRGIRYCYFTSERTAFDKLKARLTNDGVSQGVLQRQLECFVLPDELFIANFALYLYPGGIYGCGTKLDKSGLAEQFYTLKSAESERLFNLITDWREHIYNQKTIFLQAAKRLHPAQQSSEFTSKK